MTQKEDSIVACKKNNLRHCKSSRKNFQNLEEIVATYIEKYRIEVKKDLHFYAQKTSFQEVVSLAAAAKGRWHGIHGHQNKYGVALKLPMFAQNLLKVLPELEKLTNFKELYDAVEARKIKGVGQLTIYDTALRIGANLKIEPKNVYLHCGTKEGAKNLAKNFEIALRGKRFISVDELPPAFRKLKPLEIEDCLCIYKDDLKTIKDVS